MGDGCRSYKMLRDFLFLENVTSHTKVTSRGEAVAKGEGMFCGTRGGIRFQDVMEGKVDRCTVTSESCVDVLCRVKMDRVSVVCCVVCTCSLCL